MTAQAKASEELPDMPSESHENERSPFPKSALVAWILLGIPLFGFLCWVIWLFVGGGIHPLA